MSSSALLQVDPSAAPQTTASTPPITATSRPANFVREIDSWWEMRCPGCDELFRRYSSQVKSKVAYCSQRCRSGDPTPVELACGGCGTTFLRPACEVRKAAKNGWKTPYCSKRCQLDAVSRANAHPCRTCGKETGYRKRRFCSTECSDRFRDARTTTTCAHCSTSFPILTYELAKKQRRGYRVYCSKTCVGLAHSTRTARLCRTCSTPMPGERNRRYCSEDCRLVGRAANQRNTKLPREKTCPMCARVFRPKSSRTAFCDRQCANAAHALRMIGRGNSRYQDGMSYADWFRKMRPVIIERDGGVCVVCKQDPPPLVFIRNGVECQRTRLTVHHISHDPRDNRPENLILLCQPCHGKHHKSNTTPFPWFAEYATSASRSMTSRLKATATSLRERYSSTTA